MRTQQLCPQCDGYITVPAVTAIVCPACGAIGRVDDAGVLVKPTAEQLDVLLCDPQVRRIVEQASAIRQALFGGRFTLADPTGLLDPEPHPTLAAAISRAHSAPWPSVQWIVVDPSGHVAAHRSRRTTTTGEGQPT